jgi:hypothetical protein
MAEETSNIIVELYDLALTDRRDDRFGQNHFTTDKRENQKGGGIMNTG